MSHCYHYNLIPFKEISRFIVYRKSLGFVAVFCNLAGNILIFMPFGFLLPVMMRRFCTFFRVLLAGILFSICVETIQLFTQVGSFDVDDVMLNSIGTAVGFLVYWLMLKKHRSSMRRHN